MTKSRRTYCDRCQMGMEHQPNDKRPYILGRGIELQNVFVDVYICPCCRKEVEILPNHEDGYSAAAGLFSDE